MRSTAEVIVYLGKIPEINVNPIPAQRQTDGRRAGLKIRRRCSVRSVLTTSMGCDRWRTTWPASGATARYSRPSTSISSASLPASALLLTILNSPNDSTSVSDSIRAVWRVLSISPGGGHGFGLDEGRVEPRLRRRRLRSGGIRRYLGCRAASTSRRYDFSDPPPGTLCRLLSAPTPVAP
jgi:hypothetical protein